MYRRPKQNKFAVFSISFVVLMLITVIAVDGISLAKKREAYAAQEEELQEQIDQEKQRTLDLQEFEKYTKTKKYAEEIAKEKLGLVHEDEIIFKPNDKK